MKYRLHPLSSIFSAELYACMVALQIAERCSHNRSFTVIADSKTSLHSIENPKVEHLRISAIQSWLIQFSARRFCWCPNLVLIGGNEKANKEVEEVSKHQITDRYNEVVPPKDLYVLIVSKIKNYWQQTWQNVDANAGQSNKLRKINDSVSLWPSSCNKNRRYEVVLARLCIGHSLLTHGHLMEGRPLYFEDCIVPLTLKHIIAECPTYHQIRTLLEVGKTQMRC